MFRAVRICSGLVSQASRISCTRLPQRTLSIAVSAPVQKRRPTVIQSAFQPKRSVHVHLDREMIEERVLLNLRLFDKVDAEKLTLKSHFRNDLGLDSLDHVEIMINIEKEFELDIPYDDAMRLWSPAAIVRYLCDKEDIYDHEDEHPHDHSHGDHHGDHEKASHSKVH